MALTDIDGLLEPLSPEAPCGDDLSYDAAFMEVERLIPGKPEVEMAGEVHPAEEPNWSEVRDGCLELLKRTRDLRVILWLSVAVLRLEGVGGLRNALALFRGVLERYWDCVHPQLDPDDNNDPLQRINIISWLSPQGTADEVRFRQRLWEAPLCTSRRLRRSFSYRDACVARGELAAPEGEKEPPNQALIDGAFEETDTDDLQATMQALSESAQHVRAVEAALSDRIGIDRAPSLSGFVGALEEMSRFVQAYLARRGYGAEEAGMQEAQEPRSADAGAAGAARAPGEIRSTQDVLVAIDKICRYYEKNEPSSPVPLLMRRAKRLVSKSFVDIVKDLSPDSIPQLGMIIGIDEEPPKE